MNVLIFNLLVSELPCVLWLSRERESKWESECRVCRFIFKRAHFNRRAFTLLSRFVDFNSPPGRVHTSMCTYIFNVIVYHCWACCCFGRSERVLNASSDGKNMRGNKNPRRFRTRGTRVCVVPSKFQCFGRGGHVLFAAELSSGNSYRVLSVARERISEI